MNKEAFYLINGEIYRNGKFEKKALAVKNGKLYFPSEDELKNSNVKRIDLEGGKVIPGMIDLHTHGGDGVDVNIADCAGLEKIAAFFKKNGTTSFLMSVLTDSRERTLKCIESYLEFKEKESDGADLIGIHLEGPFLAYKYKGAMPESLLRKGSFELVKEYQEAAKGGIKYITVSPEVEGVLDMIPKLSELGITPAIGHSGATYEESMEAIKMGAKASTHTFNAMGLLHQHFPGVMGAVMESDVYCEGIFDGKHLHPGTVRLLLKTKGLDRVVAITDSIMAAGLPDGCYTLGINDVVVKDGDAKLADSDVRAGSTLKMGDSLKNLLRFTGLSLEKLVPIYTENPARLVNIFDRKGSIEEGKDADLVVLDKEYNITKVYTGGNSRNR